MSSRSPEDSQSVFAAFRKGLSESGLCAVGPPKLWYSRAGRGAVHSIKSRLVHCSKDSICKGNQPQPLLPVRHSEQELFGLSGIIHSAGMPVGATGEPGPMPSSN
jgi:hypothetical protein